MFRDACRSMSLHAGPWACMQLLKLACSYIGLHAVTWACMQLHELACCSLSLHSVTQACIQFLSSSEQLTRISQCMFEFAMSNCDDKLSCQNCSRAIYVKLSVSVSRVSQFSDGSNPWCLHTPVIPTISKLFTRKYYSTIFSGVDNFQKTTQENNSDHPDLLFEVFSLCLHT